MAWVVDTSVLIDIQSADPTFGHLSAKCLGRYLKFGLVICPVTYVELAPLFLGDALLQEEFLRMVGVSYLEPWTHQDTTAAHKLWADYVARKRSGKAGGCRPVADVLIEAFARRYAGLITRNPRHFATVRIVTPRKGEI
jgi:predicted nucleic acid-binding protein